MSNGNDPDDEEDSKDNELRKKVEEQTALKAFRFTREKDSPFAIDMGDGRAVTDRRPIDKSGRGLTVLQQARLKLLTEAYSVTVTQTDGGLEYIRHVNGRALSLFTHAANDSGLAQAEVSLKQASKDVQNLLSAKYGVTFSNPDEFIKIDLPDNQGSAPCTLSTRQPNFLELDAVAEALALSDPSHKTETAIPLRIVFIDAFQSALPDVWFTASTTVASQLVVTSKSDSNTARMIVRALTQNSLLKTADRKNMSVENLAEALTQFRCGLVARRDLLRTNRVNYFLVKDFDQVEVNKAYGMNSAGTNLKIRLPNGKLVANKIETQAEVRRFEEDA